jgi:hypothetical protein
VIDVDFRNLYGLNVWRAPPAGGDEKVPLLLPVYMDEIHGCVGVLNAIEQDHRRDVERNSKHFVKSADELRRRPEAAAKLDDLMPRELYRLAAYVTYSTTLVGVVESARKDLLEKLARCRSDVAEEVRGGQAERRRQLKIQFGPVFLLRDKIFAHTAFANPQGDTTSMRFTSLQVLCGNQYGWGPEGLVFGARFVFDQDPTPEVPIIGVRALARMTAAQLAGWRDLFGDAMRRLVQLSDTDILRGFENAVSVERLGERAGGRSGSHGTLITST